MVFWLLKAAPHPRQCVSRLLDFALEGLEFIEQIGLLARSRREVDGLPVILQRAVLLVEQEIGIAEVLGNDEIVHYVEGKEVLRYQRPQLDPNDADAKMLMQQRNGDVMLGGGWISLQGESHPVEFKLVEIKPLPAKATTPE